jgi:CYTH domain-containing protein
MKTFVLNLFGALGAGKSTFADLLFSYCKLHGVSCEKFDEFAKGLAWDKNMVALSDQAYIFGNHFHNFKRLDGQVQLIITDSPLPLSIYYNRVVKSFNPNYFDKMVLDSYNQFDNINYYMVRNFPYEQAGRYQTEKESVQVDKDLREILKECGIGYKEIVNTSIEKTKILAEKMAIELAGFLKLYQTEKKINNELERKFYLKDQSPLGLARPKHIIQNYLELGQSEKRVRQINGEKYFFTDKTGKGQDRQEYETEISFINYVNLLKYKKGLTIVKNRFSIPLKHVKKCEVDFFSLPKTLKTVEVEFKNREDMKSFTPPEWFGKEIFDYSNYDIAMQK